MTPTMPHTSRYAPHEMPKAKQAALNALDDILSCQPIRDAEKVEALREIEAAAKRMADNIEQWARDRKRTKPMLSAWNVRAPLAVAAE